MISFRASIWRPSASITSDAFSLPAGSCTMVILCTIALVRTRTFFFRPQARFHGCRSPSSQFSSDSQIPCIEPQSPRGFSWRPISFQAALTGCYSAYRRFRITLKHWSDSYRTIRPTVLGRLSGYEAVLRSLEIGKEAFVAPSLVTDQFGQLIVISRIPSKRQSIIQNAGSKYFPSRSRMYALDWFCSCSRNATRPRQKHVRYSLSEDRMMRRCRSRRGPIGDWDHSGRCEMQSPHIQ